MIHVVTAVGLLMCAAALIGLTAPARLTGAASRVAASPGLRGAAIALRIVFGGVAIIVADQTPYPWPMKIIGVFAVMAGTLVAMTSRQGIQGFLDTFEKNRAWSAAASLLALALGAFLLHAAT